MTTTSQPKTVVMGGGTGTYPVISALKKLHTEISTIIAVSDSGGSTGRIRDEFGFQPVGDLRQSLAALADHAGQDWIQKILLYRFDRGEGLRGHNLGNLILTALQDMTGDTSQALEIASKIFRLKGHVIPVTQQNVNLEIHYEDGSTAIGEHILDEQPNIVNKIKSVSLTPAAELSPQAHLAVAEANTIIIGPGDYYASLMAVLVPNGIPAAFNQTSAKIIYVMNLMTRLTQTNGMTTSDHVAGIEKAIGRPVDYILINNQPISQATLERYAAEQEFPVIDDLGNDLRVIRQPLLSGQLVEKAATDTTHRSLLRHDPQKLALALQNIVLQ